ncbi:FG-GAP repeat protein [Hymenobacter perfusus]|uniref:VCBS repeat-containing protein n=1 Tax=Hymenobacter perfusus TaxID=1236770 RepID=A0A3R9UXQ4_9BACT|nr:FG-GAP repeat protein [Hymenobacter perfusus]RSK42402.1 hypothetical protein EI293_15915 [Hymenobacter perfusus]
MLCLALSAALSATPAQLPAWAQTVWQQAHLDRTYVRSTYIRPSFLQADFNGDGKPDIAIPVAHRASPSRGLVIFHQGQSKPSILDMEGKASTEPPEASFDWAGQWKLYTKRSTFEVTTDKNGELNDTKVVPLKYPAIEFISDESGRGMLYWTGRAYRWLYQSC